MPEKLDIEEEVFNPVNLVKTLRYLCSPEAESMPDGLRLTTFCVHGRAAAEIIVRMHAALEELSDPGRFDNTVTRMAQAGLISEWLETEHD